MEKRQKEYLATLAGEKVRFNCSMSQYTTLHVGGKAEALYEATDQEELREVISYLDEQHIPHLPVGRGSNLLVKDKGLEGLVILLRGPMAAIESKRTDLSALNAERCGLTIMAGAGMHVADLLIYCRGEGLGGLEFLAGIPGTVGGAVAMNSGAFGEETGERVRKIHVIGPRGNVAVKNRSQLKFSYRGLELEKGSVIIRVCFELNQETEGIVAERITGYQKRRKETQPLEYPSAGSVFKNPSDDYAGRLIERAGLKGKRIGGAMISDKHANFIVNTGGAKAEDVLALLDLAREKVKKETDIELEPEIRVVGG
ncbi:MAG: UDP-N-acetylmuramate dehydrogenase [Thermodesulfobacteriota bacterium]|nr:UDP-N-acetylmuramate dehydrogenase [Thermodesulfobacteriota bacterium]